MLQSFGTLLFSTFSAYRSRFSFLMKLGFWLIFLPSLLLHGSARTYEYSLSLDSVANEIVFDSVAVGINAIAAIITTIASLLFAFTVIKALLLKRKPTVLKAISEGSAFLWSGIGLAFIMTLALIALFFIPATILAVITFFTSIPPLILGAVVLLIMIPIIYYSVCWMFSYYAHILDDKGIIDSMHQSKAVVKGRWWRTFWFSFLFGIIIAAGVIVISLVLVLPGFKLFLYEPMLAIILLTAVNGIIQFLLLSLMIVFMERFYIDLKKNPVK